MGTEKRERQKANREQKLAAAKKQEMQEGLRKRVIYGIVIAVLVFGGLYLFSLSGGDDDADAETAAEVNDDTSETDGASETSEATDDGTEATDDGTETTETTDGDSDEDTADAVAEPTCPAEDGSSDRVTAFASAPPMCIDPAGTYIAEVVTSRGEFTITLDSSRAPETVNNFVFLSRYHFYDGVTFHRIIPGFVVQGGDAVGDPLGTGDPGYRFADELPEEGDYEVGSLAMANSGPDTNGSQFFIVTGDSGTALPPQYSLFGTVTDGLDIVLDIEATGTNGGTPREETTIESITIVEG